MRKVIAIFVTLQVASITLYQLAAELGDYGEIWSALPILRSIPFILAQWLFIVLAEGALIFVMTWLWRHRVRRARPIAPHELVNSEENERLERKSTFRWDMGAERVNRSLEKSVMKTVAAFMNGRGGHLLIGVADDHSAVGLRHDYATLNRRDADGFVNHFGNVFNAMIGPHLRHLVRLEPFVHGGEECMMVAVSPSPKPAYLQDDGREELFIRTGNGTTSLKLSEAAAYIASRWGK